MNSSNVPLYTWEAPLLERAYRALEKRSARECPQIAPPLLEQAYPYATAVTKVHSRTFYMASALLPRKKRRAARALYAFCRFTDDLVDRGRTINREALLSSWRWLTVENCPTEEELVALAWSDTQVRYDIPPLYARQLVEGVARDLDQTRYETFDDLALYCYGVASTVGLMAMHIIGYKGAEAVPYAVKLGVALQLTNILRDISEDWQMGRLYLPQAELAQFGLEEGDIAAGRLDERWQRFMRFQIERVRRLYAESLPGVSLLHPNGRFAIGAAAELYRAILDDIEEHGMDIFSRRAHTTFREKVGLLPGIWWRANVVGYPPRTKMVRSHAP
ncbi:MAG: phytoene/squalene synthase family protein [Anaerolineales bacterium]